MRFLYVAPRYHTNQVPIIRGLKRKGHEVCFLSQYAGKVEDYSDLTPDSDSGIPGFSCFFDRVYMALMKNRDAYAGDRKMKCGFLRSEIKRAIRDSHGNVAILRERFRVFDLRLICFAKSIKSRRFI